MNQNNRSLAIIGSGPTAIFLLKHLFDNIHILRTAIGQILLYEKEAIMGMGMPYSPLTTDKYNMSNISSEEIPGLTESFAEWLRKQPADVLQEYGLSRNEIDESEVYSRLALGAYFHSQYVAYVEKLKDSGIDFREFPSEGIDDIIPEGDKFQLLSESGKSFIADKVVIATGHVFKEKDNPERKYFASPWPISKLLPEAGERYNFPVGILGASLSAFDVVSSLSHRHGTFSEAEGHTVYEPAAGTENFKLVMHDVNGWLPHLQYEQEEPMREIYRHVDRAGMMGLLDKKGHLRIRTYFDAVCRPALQEALRKDGLGPVAGALDKPEFGMEEFVEKMSERHEYPNAFDGMKQEMEKASESVDKNKPIHWKEVMDDLMYSLNFHAEFMPAEDHLFFHKTIMPFLMNVIAALPLCSAKILLALHDAGKLELQSGKVTVLDEQPSREATRIRLTAGEESRNFDYKMFIGCGGQKNIELEDYPFPSLVEQGFVQPAKVAVVDKKEFRDIAAESDNRLPAESGNYQIGGIAINAAYQVFDIHGEPNENLYDISFTHSSGLRPYSYGLQACSATAEIMVDNLARRQEGGLKAGGKQQEISKLYQANPDL